MKKKIFTILFVLLMLGSTIPAILMNIHDFVPGYENQPGLVFATAIGGVLGLLSFIFPIYFVYKILKFFKNSSANFTMQFDEQTGNFQTLIADEAANKPAILTELMKFKSIKSKTEVGDPSQLDLVIIHQDGSEHQYRAQIIGDKQNFKIIRLTRYS